MSSPFRTRYAACTMPRRRRTSIGEDLIEAFALLPWWACLALAVVSYFFFGWLAGRPLPPPDPARLQNIMVPAVTCGWATVGQFALPIICIAAAILSGATRWRKRQEAASWPFPSAGESARSTAGRPARAPSSPPPETLTKPRWARTARSEEPAGEAPSCPRCGRSMVMKQAKRGASAGSSFWGCTGYPACKGTRPA